MAKSLGEHFSTIDLYQPPRAKHPVVCQVVADERATTGKPGAFLRAVLSAEGLWAEDLTWVTIGENATVDFSLGEQIPCVSPYVLMVGKQAMKLWSKDRHPGLTIARTRGCCVLCDVPGGKVLCLPVMHSESILMGKNPLVKKDLIADVKFWAQVCWGDVTIDEALTRPHPCADCGGVYGPVVERENGIPWCAKCWKNEQERIARAKVEGKVVRMVDGKGKYAGKTRVGEEQGRLDV